jgi:hypothetical protein
MLILIVGVFYTWIAYGKAKRKGHSPIRWALIAAATFIGTQILVAGGISFIIGFGEGIWWSETVFYDYEIHVTIVSLPACALANWIVLQPLNKVRDNSFNEPPPPVFEPQNVN